MKRAVLSVVVAALLVLSESGIVAATSANISPHSQTRAHGQASSWTLTWGDNGPYNVVFHYDLYSGSHDVWQAYQTWSTIYTPQPRAFYPCVTKTITQGLDMDDRYGNAQHYSTVTEAGGNPCLAPVLP